MDDVQTSPFFVGAPIPTALADAHLHGFEEERRELVRIMNRKLGVRAAVVGPPGVGKTSLVLAAGPLLPGARVHIDCSRIWPSSTTGFYRLLQEALGLPPLKLEGSPAEVYPKFPLPKKAARGTLVLDDAHALLAYDEDLLGELALLAARLPHNILMTGDEAVLGRYCEELIPLRPFSLATMEDFLRRRFDREGMRLTPDAFGPFFEFTRGNPAGLQRLAQVVWQQAKQAGRKEIGPDEVDTAVIELVDRLPTATIEAWAATRGHMRDIFISMCLHDLSSPTEIGRRLGMEPKNVIVLLSRLSSQHGLVDRVERGEYRVRDPLLKHYVRKEWSSPVLR